MVAKEKANMERSRAEFEAELHLLSVKKEAATTEAELRVLKEEEGSQLDALSEAVPERHNDLTDSHPFLETRRVLNFSPGQENELTTLTYNSYLKHDIFRLMRRLMVDYLKLIVLHCKSLHP